MARDPRALLWDAKSSGVAIERFLAGKTFDEYLADEVLRSAVERQFAILGEALSQLDKQAPDLVKAWPDAAKAIAFRNVLIQGYARVDDVIVWQAAQRSLPELLRAISGLRQSAWVRRIYPASARGRLHCPCARSRRTEVRRPQVPTEVGVPGAQCLPGSGRRLPGLRDFSPMRWRCGHCLPAHTAVRARAAGPEIPCRPSDGCRWRRSSIVPNAPSQSLRSARGPSRDRPAG